MRTSTGLLAVAVACRFALDEPRPLVTLAQREVARSPSEAPSAALSADGRYVAFASHAQLVPADTNHVRDVYVLDRADGLVTLESVTPSGAASNHDSTHPGLSADGRFLVYETHVQSSNGDPEARHVVRRDRRESTMTIVTAETRGQRTAGWSGMPVISADGRIVAFASTATDLVPGRDANGAALDVYLFDASQKSTRRASLDGLGVQRDSGFSTKPSLNGDGRLVAFASTALLTSVEDGSPGVRTDRPVSQVYVRDTHRGVTRLVSGGRESRPPDGPSWAPSISADGRYVAFVSAATNLVAIVDRNGAADVFVTDLHSGLTELVSRRARGAAGSGVSGGPAISSDGRLIAFHSEAPDLVCSERCASEHEDINLLPDVFVVDRSSGVMARVSADVAGGWMESSSGPAMDAGGTVVAFSSRHPMDAADQKHDFDLFLRTIPRTLTASLR
jgi:Tol biopolymer transport system component